MGRKTVQDRANPVQVYIKQSRIDELGGIEVTREKVIGFLLSKKAMK